jgi:hypothetical protein
VRGTRGPLRINVLGQWRRPLLVLFCPNLAITSREPPRLTPDQYYTRARLPMCFWLHTGISKIRGNAMLKNVILLEIREKGSGLSNIGRREAPVCAVV